MTQTELLQTVHALTKRNGRTLQKANGDRDGIYTTADQYTGEDAFTGTLEEVLQWEQGYIYP